MTLPNQPPKCPLHEQPMRLKGLTSDGFETFACIVTRCSIQIDFPLSRPPSNPDPQHSADPADEL